MHLSYITLAIYRVHEHDAKYHKYKIEIEA